MGFVLINWKIRLHERADDTDLHNNAQNTSKRNANLQIPVFYADLFVCENRICDIQMGTFGIRER